jgi:hypothetical protein
MAAHPLPGRSETLLDLAHPLDQVFGMFRQAYGGRRGIKRFSAAHEQFSMEFVGEIVQLKTDRTRDRKTFSAARVMLGDSITARNIRAGVYP